MTRTTYRLTVEWRPAIAGHTPEPLQFARVSGWSAWRMLAWLRGKFPTARAWSVEVVP